jgi:hypothetical protein
MVIDMKTTRREIERSTEIICNKLNSLTGGMYRGKKGHFIETWNRSGISFCEDGQTGEDKIIYLTSGNTYEKSVALQAIIDTLRLIEDNQ